MRAPFLTTSRPALRGLSYLLVAALLVVYAVGRWGLPWSSEIIARQIPDSVLESMSSHSLALLDQILLEPSQLTQEKQHPL